MFRQIRSSVLAAMTVGVVMGGSTPALGLGPKNFEQGERYRNDFKTCEGGDNHGKTCVDDTDCPPGPPGAICAQRTAKCMMKYLYNWQGRGVPESDRLPSCTWDSKEGYTVVKCSGSPGVEFGQRVTVSYEGRAPDGQAEIYEAEFYSDLDCTAGHLVGSKYHSSVRPREEAGRARPVTVRVVLYNATDKEEEETVYGSKIYWADPHKVFQHWELNEKLWTCVDEDNNTMAPATECLDDGDCPPSYYCGYYDEDEEHGLTWKQDEEQDEYCDPPGWPQTFELDPNEDTYPHYCLGKLKPTDRVLFRFYTDPDHHGEYGIDDYEVTQYRVSELIPAVSQWGLVVIALLILAAGTVVIRRRRATVAQA